MWVSVRTQTVGNTPVITIPLYIAGTALNLAIRNKNHRKKFPQLLCPVPLFKLFYLISPRLA
jgi:hypothetical protein